MAHSGRFNSDGLSKEGVRRAAKRPSPRKFFYEPGTTPEALEKVLTREPLGDAKTVAYGSEEFLQYLGVNPMRIAPHGEVTVLPIGADAFEHPATALDIEKHEKASVVERKAMWDSDGWSHKGRARRNAKGEIPEWDNTALFSLSRAEMAKLSPDQMETLMRIVVDEVRHSQLSPENGNVTGHGLGFKDVVILPLHGDNGETDNVHMQAFVNRIPWNFEAKTTGSAEKDTGIWDAFRKNANDRLRDAGIDITLSEQPTAVFVKRADADDVREVVKTLEAEGIDVHPELTAGPVRGRRFQPVAADELEKAESDLTAQLLENQRQQGILVGAIKQVQGAKAAMIENEALKGEQERLADIISGLEDREAEAARQLEELESSRKKILNDLAEAIENSDKIATSLNEAESSLSEVRQQVEAKTKELTELGSLLAVEVEARNQAETLLERARSRVETLTGELATATEAVTSLTAERDDFKASSEEYQGQAVALGEQVETLTASLTESEAENRRLAGEVESLTEAVAALRADHAAFRDMVNEAAETAAEVPAGHGMSAIGTDSRIRKAVEYPAGVTVSRSMFRTRLTLPDGSMVTASDKFAKLTKGTMSDDAIAAMVAHAQREGWQPIAIAATDMKTHNAIAEAVRAAGLTVEGEETAAVIAPAPVRDAPEIPAAPPAAAPVATETAGRGFPDWVRHGRAETEEEQKALEAAYQRWQASTLKKADELMAQSAAEADRTVANNLAREAEGLRDRAAGWSSDDYLAFRHSTYQARVEGLRWRERDPSNWTNDQRKAAREAFKKADLTGVTLNEWAESQHRIWRTEHPEEAARQDAERERPDGGNTRKPE